MDFRKSNTEPTEIRIVGSAHGGRRGDFRSCLFVATRRAGEGSTAFDAIDLIPVEGITGDRRVMGLVTTPGGLLALAGSSDAAFLALFDHQLRQTGWHQLAEARDPHGLVVEDGWLWAVSSGTNEVIRYKLSAAVPGAPEVVHRHSLSEPQHFNGLARHGNLLVLSAFGVSANGARSVASTGYLMDIQSGQVLRSSLDQPHSPLSRGECFWFCESQTGLVWRDQEPLPRLDGYLRGLTIAPDGLIHVAASASRPPRELLTDDRPPAVIWTLDPDGNAIRSTPLAGVGAEVYDLVCF